MNYEDVRLMELCKKFTDDSTKTMNSTTFFNILKRNKIKTTMDLHKATKGQIILMRGIGAKRLSVVLQMKDYLNSLKEDGYSESYWK